MSLTAGAEKWLPDERGLSGWPFKGTRGNVLGATWSLGHKGPSVSCRFQHEERSPAELSGSGVGRRWHLYPDRCGLAKPRWHVLSGNVHRGSSAQPQQCEMRNCPGSPGRGWIRMHSRTFTPMSGILISGTLTGVLESSWEGVFE